MPTIHADMDPGPKSLFAPQGGCTTGPLIPGGTYPSPWNPTPWIPGPLIPNTLPYTPVTPPPLRAWVCPKCGCVWNELQAGCMTCIPRTVVTTGAVPCTGSDQTGVTRTDGDGPITCTSTSETKPSVSLVSGDGC